MAAERVDVLSDYFINLVLILNLKILLKYETLFSTVSALSSKVLTLGKFCLPTLHIIKYGNF